MRQSIAIFVLSFIMLFGGTAMPAQAACGSVSTWFDLSGYNVRARAAASCVGNHTIKVTLLEGAHSAAAQRSYSFNSYSGVVGPTGSCSYSSVAKRYQVAYSIDGGATVLGNQAYYNRDC